MAKTAVDPELSDLSPEEAFKQRTSDLTSPEGRARAGFVTYGNSLPNPHAAAAPVAAAAAPAAAVATRTAPVLQPGRSLPFGAVGAATGQSPEQAAAQDDFDRRMGFPAVNRSASQIKAVAQAVNPAAAVPPTTDPLTALSTPPSIGGYLPSASTAYLGVPGAPSLPTLPIQPGYADTTGVRGAVGPVKRFLSRMGQFFNPGGAEASPISDPTGIVSAAPAVGKGVMAAGQTLNAGADAGISNASASQFEKPTKANPVVKTPTSPVKAIDKTDSSLSRFGFSEEELNRRRQAFAGF